MRPSYRDGILLGVFALSLILWWNPLLRGLIPDFMDTVAFHYPKHLSVSRILWAGELPHWGVAHFGGAPLAANPQVALWYPPNWLMFAFPGPLSYGLIILFHYLIAGLGIYALARYFGLRRLAAFAGMMLFAFSTVLVSRIALMPHLMTIGWIAWMLLSLEMMRREERFFSPGLLLLTVAASLQVLAGAPQITFYTLLAIIVYVVISVYPRNWQIGIFMTLKMSVAAILVGLIVAIQLLPTLEYLQQVDRQPITSDRLRSGAINGSFHWRALIGFTGPELEDTDSINAIGILALLLALLSPLVARFRWQAIGCLTVMVLSYFAASVVSVPFLERALPGYTAFNAPRRILILFTVFGIIAAMIGFHGLLERLHRLPALLRHPAEVLVVVLLLGSSLWILPRLEREFTGVDRFDPGEERLSLLHGQRYLTLDPFFNYSYDSRRPDYGISLLPNLAAWHGLEDLQGYDPLVPRRLAVFRNQANRMSGNFYPSHGAFFSNPGEQAMRLYGLQFLVGEPEFYDPARLIPGTQFPLDTILSATEEVLAHELWPIRRFTEERPRAWFVSQLAPAVNEREALALAFINDVYVVAFSEDAFTSGFFARDPPPEFIQTASGRITLRFEDSAQERFVVIGTTWMPGWRASFPDSGMRPLLLPINGTIMGVIVPPGVTTVELRYLPTSFLRGFLLTIAGLVGLMLLLLAVLRAHPKTT